MGVMKFFIGMLIGFSIVCDVSISFASSTTLKYDDGISDLNFRPWSDNIGSEVAVRFTPISYPARLNQVQFFVSGNSVIAASTVFQVRIYDDDNGGYPGTLLSKSFPTASATKQGEWVTVDVSQQGISVADGDFFVSMYWLTPPGASGENDNQSLGMDGTAPIHGRSFAKWGGNDSWHPMSYATCGDMDAMIRAIVGGGGDLIRVRGVPVASIVLDGQLSDWGGISPVYVDATGDNTTLHPGCDIENVYVATNSTQDRLYVALKMTDLPNTENAPAGSDPLVGYLIHFDDYGIQSSGTTYHDWQIGIDRANNFWVWDLRGDKDYDNSANLTFYSGSTNTITHYHQNAVIEFSFPISIIELPESFGMRLYLWLRDGQNTNPDTMGADVMLTFDPSLFPDFLTTKFSPQGLLTWMQGNITYGWPGYEATHDISTWLYKAPDEVFYSKRGECISQSAFEAYVLEQNGYPCNLLFVNRLHNSDHGICYWKEPGGYYYLEHAFYSFQGIHGPFFSVQEMGEDVYGHLVQMDGRVDTYELSHFDRVPYGVRWEEYLEMVEPFIPLLASYVSSNGACGDKKPCYCSIQQAVNDADSGCIIRIVQGTYSEPIIFNFPKFVSLQGGWDPTFTSHSSFSTVTSLTILNGTISPDRIVLK